MGGCPAGGRVFSSILDLYPLDSSSISSPTQVVATSNVSRHCQIFPGGQNYPQLRIKGPDQNVEDFQEPRSFSLGFPPNSPPQRGPLSPWIHFAYTMSRKKNHIACIFWVWLLSLNIISVRFTHGCTSSFIHPCCCTVCLCENRPRLIYPFYSSRRLELRQISVWGCYN